MIFLLILENFQDRKEFSGHFQNRVEYRCPLYNIGLNCTSPLIHRFFFREIRTVILHDLRLVESQDAGLWIWRTDYKVIGRFSTGKNQRPKPRTVQGSTWFNKVKLKEHTIKKLNLYLNTFSEFWGHITCIPV